MQRVDLDVNSTISGLSVTHDGTIAFGYLFLIMGKEMPANIAIFGCDTPQYSADTKHGDELTHARFSTRIAAFNSQALECDQIGDES